MGPPNNVFLVDFMGGGVVHWPICMVKYASTYVTGSSRLALTTAAAEVDAH